MERFHKSKELLQNYKLDAKLRFIKYLNTIRKHIKLVKATYLKFIKQTENKSWVLLENVFCLIHRVYSNNRCSSLFPCPDHYIYPDCISIQLNMLTHISRLSQQHTHNSKFQMLYIKIDEMVRIQL